MVSLLDLPYELHCEIIKELPLGSRIIYQTQICRPLRILFAGRFTLPQPFSFRLVEWRRASSEVAKLLQREEQQKLLEGEDGETSKVAVKGAYMHIPAPKKSIWDTSPSSTPKPAPAKLRGPFQNRDEVSALAGISNIVGPLSVNVTDGSFVAKTNIMDSIPHADHSDVDLFARCLKLLGKLNEHALQDNPNQLPLPSIHLATPLIAIPIRVLSLLSRTGFKVASLIYFLQNVPALHSVETILMTPAGNAELILWSLFQPSREAFQCSHTCSPIIDMHSDEGNISLDMSTCAETQAIVVPGPFAERGQGLRSGFKCLCFHSPHQQNDPVDADKKTFHVIFHDWYDEGEAEGTQDMLHYSDITCNACKQTIIF